MSDKVQFKATLDVSAQSETIVTEFCVKHLQARGFMVAPPSVKWEALGNFMQRIGVSNYSSIRRSIKYWLDRGEQLPIRRTAGGRIIELLSNPSFDKFCLRNKATTNG